MLLVFKLLNYLFHLNYNRVPFRVRLGELFDLLEKLEKQEGIKHGAMDSAGLRGMGGWSKR